MIVYLRGTILSVSDPETVGSQGTKIQRVVIQHAWNENGKYNKYAMVDILGEDKIKNMALKPQEEVEMAIDINARMGTGGRWFNSITAFAVERNKKKFHFYENNRQRDAVVPNMPAASEELRTKSEESKLPNQAADDPLADAAGVGDLPY